MNIDFHAHILPGADHGSANLEVSIKQVALASQAGIDVLIATPHFYPHLESPEAFLARREETAALLRQKIPEKAPRLLIGSETHLCRGLHNMEHLEKLCVEGTNVLLLELPADFSVRAYESTLEGLLYDRKLTVVLAHIDRYSSQIIDFLMELGFLAQINAESFCRLRTRRRSAAYIGDPRVVALGSDIHGLSVGYREFLEMRRRLGEEYSAVMRRTAQLLKL
ncbi:MAG: CpsB/CapC family capsule biosynthesis tyrosine phosphatase [Faecousia sp.]